MANKNTFEEQLNELEKIVANLENGNVPLEEALDQFKTGVAISKNLEKTLSQAEETVVKLINDDGSTTKIDPNNAGAPEE